MSASTSADFVALVTSAGLNFEEFGHATQGDIDEFKNLSFLMILWAKLSSKACGRTTPIGMVRRWEDTIPIWQQVSRILNAAFDGSNNLSMIQCFLMWVPCYRTYSALNPMFLILCWICNDWKHPSDHFLIIRNKCYSACCGTISWNYCGYKRGNGSAQRWAYYLKLLQHFECKPLNLVYTDLHSLFFVKSCKQPSV